MLNNLGKFKIVSEVGRGAMGVVYRAEDNLGRSVALKVLPPRFAGDADLVQRFNREARAAAGLKHPNIVVIYESSQIDDTSFIAMEFIEGESLEQVISSRQAVPIVKKLDIIIQTCRGLQYAHKKQIVHRDVKPSNIMVEHDGTVKIVDFGIAHLGGGTLLTLGGQILGTPAYMSPEQTQGRALDARSDIFSIGVMLFELLTYQKPFPGNDIASVWYKIQNEQPPPLSELLPACPLELQKAVSKALAKNREDRYQAAEDLGFALQQVSDYFKHDMIAAYVQEGRRFLEEGNLTVAKESIQRALEIDSGHDVARSLFDQVQERIEARRRAQRVEQVLRQAKEALQANQFDQAIVLLEEVLQLEPAHDEARQYRTLAVERRERERKITQHMERAEKLAADADLQGAKKELEALLALDGAHSAARKKLDGVVKELAEQERQRQVRHYTQDARNHVAQKNFDQAREMLEKALALDPINLEVEALLRQVRTSQEREKERQRREERLAGIQGALNTQDFGQALALAEQGLEEFPADPQVLKLHAQATRLAELEKQRRYIEEQLQLARSFFQKDQYAEAVNVLQRALERFPNDVRLTSYLKTVQETQQQAAVESLRREAIRKAGALIREKKFALAIGALEEALARAGESPEILEVLQFAREQQTQQQKEERIQQVLTWAHICLREQNFEEALRVLELARRELSSPDIDALLATAGEQQQQFEQRRVEMMRQARRSLEAGEAGAAVALLEPAPKAYFKNEDFRQLYAQCREGLDRATFVRITAAELEKAEAEGNLEQAKNLLQQALQTYPNEATLLAAQERLRAEELRLRRMEWRKLIDEAKVAVGRMEYERAGGILASLPPETANAPDLASEARVLLASARDQQRNFELRREETLQQARDLLKAGDAVKAAALLDAAPKGYLKNEEYQRLQAQCREGLERAGFISSTLAHIETCLQRQDLIHAEAALRQALRRYPQESALLAAGTRLGKEKSRLRRVEWTKLVDEARAAVSRTDYARALEVLKALPPELAEEPDLALEARTLQAQASQSERQLAARRQALDEAKRHISANNFSAAIEVLEKAAAVEGPSPELAERLQYARQRKIEQERQDRVRQLVTQVHRLQVEHNYEDAVLMLEQAQNELNAAEIDALLATVSERKRQFEEHQRKAQWRKVIDEVKNALGRASYQRAIDLLAALPPEIAASPELASEAAALLDEARQKEKGASISREALRVAREQMRTREYLRAIETLEKALAVAGPSTDLAGLLKQAREQAEQVRQERIRRVLDQARRLQRDNDYDKAVSLLEQAQRELGAKEIDSLLAAVKEQRQLARQRAEILQRARQLLAAGDAAQAVALLDAAPKTFLENEELRRIHAACHERLERVNFISSNKTRIETLLSTGDLAQARTLLHQTLKKYPGEPSLLALQERLQQEESRLRHAEQMRQLRAIEQRISSTKRSKLEGLAHQVQQIAAGYGADDELTAIAARIRQRIEAEIAAPAAPRKPLPWRRVALGVTAVAALVAAIGLGSRFFHKRTVPAEIQNEPVQKTGHETTQGQPEIATGESRWPAPKAPLQPAKSVATPPSKPALSVAKGSTSQRTTQVVAPSTAVTMNRPGVAPPAVPKAPEPASPASAEEQDWERARGATDPATVEQFLQKYSSGPHALEAQAKLQDLVWASTNRNDLGALQAYLKRFPNGPHSGEASRQMEEVAWARLDKRDAQALRSFMAQYPNGAHSSDARSMLTRIKTEQEQLSQQLAAKQAILAALGQFNAAFKVGKPREGVRQVRHVWPTVPPKFTEAMSVPGSTFVMELNVVGDPVVSGDAASVPCQLVTRTTVSGRGPSQTQKTGTVTLRKDGDHWTIITVLGVG